MKTIGRDKIRKKPLEHDCYSAKTSRHEYGNDDNRVFCYGLYNEADCLMYKCMICPAHVYNAEPPAEDGDGE